MTPHHEARFRSLFKEGPESECWPWLGYTNRGVAYFSGCTRSNMVASRVAWMLKHGEIPAGKLIIHTCELMSCVNPSHLKLGTHADRHRATPQKTACVHCGTSIMRVTYIRRPTCKKCCDKGKDRRQKQYIASSRAQARRYRIVLHVLGWEDSEFNEMLEEMKKSPMGFRDRPESRLAHLDETNERKAETRRLLEAYADGVDIEDLVERFGLTPDAINARAIRAGVQRPSGHIGAIRRAQRKTA